MASGKEKLKDGKASMAEHATADEHSPSTISPYTTRAVIVSIGASGAKYTLLEAIVNQYSGLKRRIDPKHFETPIELREVDEDIGHTLIHFIYTGRYQTLGLDSIPRDLRDTVEFKRSVLAYCAALLCGIEALEALTKVKIEDLGKELSVFDIQLVVEEVHPKLPQDDDWFPEHMQKWIKSKLIADATPLKEGRLLDVIGRSAMFDRAVVQSITEMWSEQVNKARGHADSWNHVAPTQEPAAVSPKINGAAAARSNVEQPRSASTTPLAVQPTTQNRLESVITAEIPLRITRESKIETQPTQNGSVAAPLQSEDPATETPSESWTGASEDQPRGLSDEPLEAARRRSETNGKLQHGENLRDTDSEGEVSKPKPAKKGKKTKKRKDSISVAM